MGDESTALGSRLSAESLAASGQGLVGHAVGFLITVIAWFVACATVLRQRQQATVGAGAAQATGVLLLPAYMAGYAAFCAAAALAATTLPFGGRGGGGEVFRFLLPGSSFLRAAVLTFVVNMAVGVVVAWLSRGKTEEQVCDNFTVYAYLALALALACMAVVWVMEPGSRA